MYSTDSREASISLYYTHVHWVHSFLHFIPVLRKLLKVMLQSKLEQQFTKQKTRRKVRCKCRWIWNHKKFAQCFRENFCHNFKKTASIWIKVGTHNLHAFAQAWHPRSSSSDNIRQDTVVDTARDLRVVIDSGLSISDHIHCRLLLSLLSALSVTYGHTFTVRRCC